MAGRKSIPFCINLHKSKLYNMWSALLLETGPGLLFNCPPTAFLYISLCTRKAKGWDKGSAQLGIVSLL
jgi:hypothetical protein